MHEHRPGLTADEHRAFVEQFGPVAEPHGHISNVEADGYQPEWPLLWHSDFMFTPNPLWGISLYALEIGDGCAPTRFVNTAEAAADLPADLRRRLEGKEVVHLADLTGAAREDVRQRLVDKTGPAESYPSCTRPILWRHPRTGQELLQVGEQQASHVVGLDHEESESLLAEVFAHLYDSRRIHEHHWREGDLLVWDNLTLLHSRPAAPVTVRRSFRRFTITPLTLAEIMGGLTFTALEVRRRLA